MTTKISAEIHKTGGNNTDILKMVAAHNEGTINANVQHIAGLLLSEKVKYPSANERMQYKTEGDTMHITEDNWQSTTLSLTWKEVYELAPVDSEIEKELELH